MQRNNNDKGKQNEVRTEQDKSNSGINWNRFENKKQEYRMKQKENKENQKEKNMENNNGGYNGSRKQWPLQSNEFKAKKKSANKYSILEDLPEDDPVEIDTLKGRMEKWKEDRVKEADMSNQQTMEDGNLEEDIVKSENELEENSWVIMGDMNVTFNIEEHSSGGSFVTEEMQEFRDCVNSIKVEDIGSSATLTIPTDWQKKAKSFRFANYIADKPDFIVEVDKGWKIQVQGHKMYCLVKILKSLKPILNKLNWKNKDLTARVEALREKSRNRVDTICDENEVKSIQEEVPIQFVKHFQQFLGTSYEASVLSAGDDFFSNTLTQEEDDFMVRKISDNEVKEAMFDIGDNRAPGPDGFSSFFKRAWNVVGKDDNIMLSKEILRGYDRKNGPKRCAMKIDLRKAYDIINWHGYFKGGRGLRQGDPMSPYLFTLVMEVLTLLLQRRIRNNNGFKYHYGCKEIKLVNLCFADDLMTFCNGDSLSARVIKEALQEFSAVLGLFPNLNKSTLYFGSLIEAEKDQIRSIMQFREGSLPIKRLMLIAAVLESMSMYWASVFKLPKSVIKEINGILKRFLWSNGDPARVGIGSAFLNGLLIEKITYKDLYDVRMPRMIKLADTIDEGKWKWPRDKDWIAILAPKMNMTRTVYKWDEVVTDLLKFKHGKNIWSVMRRISFAAMNI
ncbi:RNA-directed DNA polymerase, eukaryota, reverse transcriptase zinc-binding domain protein [Tanacetum coccineum]